MEIADYVDVCSPAAAARIHALCGIYWHRYATVLSQKGMEKQDLEQEVVLKILEDLDEDGIRKKYNDDELVRNARRDIFDIIHPDASDEMWNEYEDEDAVYSS
jgi:hypothetical protein